MQLLETHAQLTFSPLAHYSSALSTHSVLGGLLDVAPRDLGTSKTLLAQMLRFKLIHENCPTKLCFKGGGPKSSNMLWAY